MDPTIGSVIVALIASLGAIVTAVLTARGSAERITDKERIRRMSKRLTELGEDPDDF